MSYCRWSSDDFQCDIYCYYSVGDFYQIFVAGNRIVGDIPKLLPYPSKDGKIVDNTQDKEGWDAWFKRHQEQMNWLKTCERKPIGLPYDGQSFEEPDAQTCLDRLLELQKVGYRFPDYVLEAIKEEIVKV